MTQVVKGGGNMTYSSNNESNYSSGNNTEMPPVQSPSCSDKRKERRNRCILHAIRVSPLIAVAGALVGMIIFMINLGGTYSGLLTILAIIVVLPATGVVSLVIVLQIKLIEKAKTRKHSMMIALSFAFTEYGMIAFVWLFYLFGVIVDYHRGFKHFEARQIYIPLLLLLGTIILFGLDILLAKMLSRNKP